MTDFKLTTTGDLDLTTGDIQLISGSEEIAQHLRIRLKFFIGEWFLDTRLGIPYIQKVFRKNPNSNVVRDLIQRAALSTPGVLEIQTLTFDFDSANRRLAVDLRALITGDEVLDFSEELIL